MMALTGHRRGIVLMLAGLSKRSSNAPIKPKAIKVWLQNEAIDQIIDKEVIWLFRAGYITTTDGEAYSLTELGWNALDSYFVVLEELEQEMEARFGPISDGPFVSAKNEVPTNLLLLGEADLGGLKPFQ